MSDFRDELSNVLGVWQPLNTGRYLGLPSLIERNKKSVFNFLRERLWRRLQGWRGKSLSKAGKEILIKSAAQSIPAYCMSSFLLLVTLTDKLERMMNSFWWGYKRDATRGINWLKWDKLCVMKNQGGLGFRNLQLFNIAMLEKVGWRLISDPDALLCRVLKAKYFPRGDFLNAPCGHSPSFTWRSIFSSQDLIRKGTRWKIEFGDSINVWLDPWLHNESTFFLRTSPDPTLLNVRVKDLLIPVLRLWDAEMIQELFEPEDVNDILFIPLNPVATADILITLTEDQLLKMFAFLERSCLRHISLLTL